MQLGSERADVCSNYNITYLLQNLAKDCRYLLANKLFFDHSGMPAHRAKTMQMCFSKH